MVNMVIHCTSIIQKFTYYPIRKYNPVSKRNLKWQVSYWKDKLYMCLPSGQNHSRYNLLDQWTIPWVNWLTSLIVVNIFFFFFYGKNKDKKKTTLNFSMFIKSSNFTSAQQHWWPDWFQATGLLRYVGITHKVKVLR